MTSLSRSSSSSRSLRGWCGLAAAASSFAALPALADPTYVDAGPANTTLADGTALVLQTAVLAADPPQYYTHSSDFESANGHWHHRTGIGNGSNIFASQATNDSPVLRTTLSGLTPGESYAISVYFWVAGSGAPTGNQEWDLRAGLDAGALTDIRPNTAGVVRLDTSGVTFTNSVLVTEADRRLQQYTLGTATASAAGEIAIYVDAFSGNDDRTWYDGVGHETLAPPEPAVWTGLGTDGKWSQGANWQSGSPPAAGDTLVFTGGDHPESVNDLAEGTAFGGLRFDVSAGAYQLSGNRLKLTGPLLSQAASQQSIEAGFALDDDHDLECNLLAGSVALDGPLTGVGGLVKAGPGLLEVAGANAYSGGTVVTTGPLSVFDDQRAADGGWQVGPGTAAATTVTFASGSQVKIAAGKEVRVGDAKESLASGLASQTLSAAGAVTNDGSLQIGLQAFLEVTDGGSWVQNGPLAVTGYNNWNSRLSVFTGGSFSYAGAVPVAMKAGTGETGRARIVIDGGVLTTGQPFQQEGTGSPTPLLILSNGGTVSLSASIADLAVGVEVQLGAGGGLIDTGAHAVGIAAPVSGEGSLTKTGAGTLTVDQPGYAGDTQVTAGVLSLGAATLGDSSAVVVATGAKLELAYSGADTIGSLTLGGQTLTTGTYSAATHPAFLSGSGSLTIGSGFSAWAAQNGLSGDPDADADGDGLADVLEYVFGTQPGVADAAPVSVSAAGTTTFVFHLVREVSSKTPDLVLKLEVGPDLESWPQSYAIGAATDPAVPEVVITANGDGTESIDITAPRNGASRLFARLRAEVGP